MGPDSYRIQRAIYPLQTAALELQKQHKRHALAAVCGGAGQGCAVVLARA